MSGVLPERVVITRPRHPLQGQELRVLGRTRRDRQPVLLLVLPDGSNAMVPAAWTSLADDGPAAGHAEVVGTLADLLAACALVSAFSARAGDARGQAARKPPAKEDDRAACAAQSAAGQGSGATCDDDPALPGRPGHGGDAAGPADRRGGSARRDQRPGGRGSGR